MYFILYPLRYLALRDDRGALVLWRDVIPGIVIALPLFLFFQYVNGSNFFARGGLLEKAGSVTASLTGFYIAGLLAVATFTASKSALDNPIKVGPVFLGSAEKRQALSRRDYVCLIFGYLSFLSLTFSLSAAVGSSAAGPIEGAIQCYWLHVASVAISVPIMVSAIVKAILLLALSHLVVTTGYGLYYLTKKIYEKEPEVVGPIPKKTPRVRQL